MHLWRPRRRATAALVSALIALCLSPVLSHASTGCGDLRSRQTGRTGTWETFATPHFVAGPQLVTSHVLDPTDPRLWFATNGTDIERSIDGGCTWGSFYSIGATPSPSAPFRRGNDEITTLAMPSRGNGGHRLYASVRVLGTDVVNLVDESGGPDQPLAAATVVLTGFGTLSPAGVLAQPLGSPGPLVVAPSDPQTVYAVAGGLLNVSTDGGSTWSPGGPVNPSNDLSASYAGSGTSSSVATGQSGIVGLAVDPADARSVWARTVHELQYSGGGGTTWFTAAAADGLGILTGPVVQRDARGSARIQAFEQPSLTAKPSGLLESTNGGTSFATQPMARLGTFFGAPTSMTSLGDALVVTTSTRGAPKTFPRIGVFARPAGGAFFNVDEFRLSPLYDATATQSGERAVAFRSDNGLVRWTGVHVTPVKAPPPSVTPSGVVVSRVTGGLPPLSRDTVAVPLDTEITVPLGKTVRVPYRVFQAADPTPIDVFFMLDTSTSMDDVVQAVAQSFVDVTNALGQQRIDVDVGLGEYQSSEGGGFRYRRDVDISPPGDAFRSALNGIRTSGGTEDAYTALDQMATGTGIADPLYGDPVSAGEDAHWRPGTIRVVVHSSDESLQPDRSGPNKDDVIQDLASRRILHLGLPVIRTTPRQVEEAGVNPTAAYNNQVTLVQDMKDLSAGTHAFAPPGGVDCNGDGKPDLPVGAPLVCKLYDTDLLHPLGSPIQLTGLLESALGTIVDRQPAGLTVLGGVGRGLRAQVVRPLQVIDVKQTHELGSAVDFSCPGARTATAPLSYLVRIAPQVGVRAGRVSYAHVSCVVPPPPPLAQPVVPAVLAVVPGAEVPAQAPAAAPNPAPAQQPAQAIQPAGAAQAQAGAAVALEEQHEVSLQQADDGPRGQQTMASSMLTLSGALGLAACGLVLSRRRRSAEAFGWARVDTRPDS